MSRHPAPLTVVRFRLPLERALDRGRTLQRRVELVLVAFLVLVAAFAVWVAVRFT